ncbi:hypothetical protein [Burkholderia metallica]|uniref:hypothetical protein n=1 Tax=Burkholderia metallica TaxID=488729 RepID=UPI000D19C319|nr:hypothetical protein [Burkholderia metallica]
METITLTTAQRDAMRSAILAGALAERQATLRLLIAQNADHISIASAYERELEELLTAARDHILTNRARYGGHIEGLRHD